MPNTKTVYTFIPKSEFEARFGTVAEIDAVVNSHNATKINAVVSLFAALVKKSVPGALAVSTIQGAVAAVYDDLQATIAKYNSKYPDWCVVIETTLGCSGWGTGSPNSSGGYLTYDRIVSSSGYVEVGEY